MSKTRAWLIWWDRPVACATLGAWLWHSWSFVNRFRVHERGVRLAGFTLSNWRDGDE